MNRPWTTPSTVNKLTQFAATTFYQYFTNKYSFNCFHKIWSWYSSSWWVGCFIWYSEEGLVAVPTHLETFLAVPNVTARQAISRYLHSIPSQKIKEKKQNKHKSAKNKEVQTRKRKNRHMSALKEDTTSTACELTMLILSISVTFSVTCLTVASLITKSCQQRWPIHCSFHKVVH